MKVYAVQNDKGEWLTFEPSRETPWYTNYPTLFKDKTYAESQADLRGGHVVTLCESPEPVEVSAEEAAMLERAKSSGYPVSAISGWCDEGEEDHTAVEDRLMHAYVDGWKVEKPKRWNVKVPHVDAQEGLWFFVNSDGKVDAAYDQDLAQKFTAEEIEHYGLGDCQKVACADSARTTGEVKH